VAYAPHLPQEGTKGEPATLVVGTESSILPGFYYASSTYLCTSVRYSGDLTIIGAVILFLFLFFFFLFFFFDMEYAEAFIIRGCCR
jgi:hypothetical protein